MKAFTIDRYGSNDNVHAVQVPDPHLRDDDVLVEIHAASINPLDAKSGTARSNRSCRIACP